MLGLRGEMTSGAEGGCYLGGGVLEVGSTIFFCLCKNLRQNIPRLEIG